MNRKFLVLVAVIAGLVALASLLFFAYASETRELRGGESITHTMSAIAHVAGVMTLMLVWLATACALLLQLPGFDFVKGNERTYRVVGLMAWKLVALLQIAHFLAGDGMPAQPGFATYVTFIASIVGALAFYLSFNDKLAGKLAEKAKEMKAAATKEDEKPADDDATS